MCPASRADGLVILVGGLAGLPPRWEALGWAGVFNPSTLNRTLLSGHRWPAAQREAMEGRADPVPEPAEAMEEAPGPDSMEEEGKVGSKRVRFSDAAEANQGPRIKAKRTGRTLLPGASKDLGRQHERRRWPPLHALPWFRCLHPTPPTPPRSTPPLQRRCLAPMTPAGAPGGGGGGDEDDEDERAYERGAWEA
jgi:hypothetical protein